MEYVLVVIIVLILIIPLTLKEESIKEKIPKYDYQLNQYIEILTNKLDNSFYLFKKPFEIPEKLEQNYWASISYRSGKL